MFHIRHPLCSHADSKRLHFTVKHWLDPGKDASVWETPGAIKEAAEKEAAEKAAAEKEAAEKAAAEEEKSNILDRIVSLFKK